ncbi:MAG: RDD family protein [Kangiellaceae bacterium]|jgi:uncharacterized RDD family membrane protein YckC|nr:RDD family protein [Kangiellaceae bacterium]
MTPSQKKIALHRFLAFAVDWLIIALWGSLLVGVVMWIYSAQPPAPSGPWHGQLIGFCSMTLPVVLYFSICEASAWRASIGKKVLSLRLIGSPEKPVAFSRVLLRNLIKFAPWELGHSVAQQAIFAGSSTAAWLSVPMVLSLLVPVWWVVSIYLRGVAPYDQVVGISVVSRLES